MEPATGGSRRFSRARWNRLSEDWAQRVRSLVSHSLRSISADLDQAAEMMWKGVLAHGEVLRDRLFHVFFFI